MMVVSAMRIAASIRGIATVSVSVPASIVGIGRIGRIERYERRKVWEKGTRSAVDRERAAVVVKCLNVGCRLLRKVGVVLLNRVLVLRRFEVSVFDLMDRRVVFVVGDQTNFRVQVEFLRHCGSRSFVGVCSVVQVSPYGYVRMLGVVRMF